MLDLKKLIAKILALLNAPIVYQEFTLSGSTTLAAHASASKSVPWTAPTGYTALCSVKARPNGAVILAYLDSGGTSGTSGNITVWLRNTSTGSQTISSVTIGMLFIKDA